jgi:hypothetical protein
MKSPTLVVLENWPQPHSVSEAVIFADESSLLLRYTTANDAVAIIKFPLVSIFKFGSPNDEALGGHPLSSKGLKFYSVYRVDNSPWIDDLEKQNSVHHRHDKKRFLENKTHYIFTFQDSCLECVVYEGEFWKPIISVFPTAEEASHAWKTSICASQETRA